MSTKAGLVVVAAGLVVILGIDNEKAACDGAGTSANRNTFRLRERCDRGKNRDADKPQSGQKDK